MKETDILSGFTTPKHPSELTDEANSTYAKSRISQSYMPDATTLPTADNPVDLIDMPLGGRRDTTPPRMPRNLDRERQQAYEIFKGAYGREMTDEEKELYEVELRAPRIDPAVTAMTEQQRRDQMGGTNQPDELAQVLGGARGRNRQRAGIEGNAGIEAYLKQPENIYELVQSLASAYKDFHSRHHFYETNEMGEIISISDANILRWVREQILYYESEDGPDTTVNYFQKINIPLKNGAISIGSILQNDDKFLTEPSHDSQKLGFKHIELSQQIRRELYARTTIRDRDIRYRRDGKGMGDDEGISGTYFGILKESSMTRSELWNGKSLMYWAMEAPFDFVEESTVSDEEKKNDPLWRTKRQDTRLGRATATALMAYYHLCDVEKLREMLGNNSPFFQRSFWEQGRIELAKQDLPANPQYIKSPADMENPIELARQFISDDKLDKIFGANGQVVENASEFVAFLNFFAEAQANSNERRLVRYVLQQAIGHKYRLTRYDEVQKKDVMDEEMLRYAESQAFFMTRWTGIAARNDWGAVAYDAQSKILHTQEYRLKQASPDRGGAFGNMYNVGMFKALGVNYLDAITTMKSKDGKPLLLREVLEDIVRVPMITKEEEKASDPQDMQSPLMKERVEALEALSGLTFAADTEQNLANNGTNRWYGEFHSFIGGKELHLQKTVEWARLRGVVYDPAAFGELIQEGFLKPLRYGYSTWRLQFDKEVRDMVDYPENAPEGTPYVIVGKDKITGKDKKKMFVNTSMAEMMFGNQVLDVEDFWQKVPKRDKDGSEVKDADGKVVYEKTVPHLLDATQITRNRPQLFKQMALARIAADIRSHRDFFNSPYPQWDAATVEALIKALERVPGGLLVDENDLSNTMVPTHFFSKEDIRYLRSLAHVTYGQMAKTDGLLGLGKAGVTTFGKFAKAFWKGLK